ncbi:biotin--[acetyl-CoA-carboxylase] ligase [Ectothiorhodospira magna]|nr:biotin--[acetyl-CoA-carboxylase] ligase [Ectothiorhodospira magna]
MSATSSSVFPQDFPAGLLRALARQAMWSPNALAQHLGVSGHQVVAGLEALSALGLALREEGTQVGLRDPLELLDAERITAARTGPPLRLQVLEQVDSTNAWLARQQASPVPMACVADIQWAGRGRRGRPWLMPLGAGLPLSIGWDIRHWPALDPTITLAAGAVVIQALTGLGARGLSLKWPNDILVHGRKLGGILVEGQVRAGTGAYLILGLGLNRHLPGPLSIDQPHGDLREAGIDPALSCNMLAAALLDALAQLPDSYPDPGFAAYQSQWQAHDACAGQPVVVHQGAHTLTGEGGGVDEQGRLRVLTTTGPVMVEAGEVTLRLLLSTTPD